MGGKEDDKEVRNRRRIDEDSDLYSPGALL
jgi:hypothetical protein